jgi:hypothetical protein
LINGAATLATPKVASAPSTKAAAYSVEAYTRLQQKPVMVVANTSGENSVSTEQKKLTNRCRLIQPPLE